MGIIKRYNSRMYGNYWSAIFKYGFFIGIIMSFVVIFRFCMEMPLTRPLSYTEDLILLLLIFGTVFLYKSKLEHKKITLKESYVVGLGAGVIASIIYGMFLYVYIIYLDPDFQTRYIDIQRAVEANKHLADAEIKLMTTPSSIALSAILLSSIMSVLWALLVAIVLRNEKAEVRVKKLK